MASASGPSSGSSSLNLSSDQENLHRSDTMTDIRKRKRMLSNRESARRSRMRKQKHLDDLTAEIANLRAANGQILSNTNLVTEMWLSMESENSVLRTQVAELTQRLRALSGIISCMGSMEAYGGPDHDQGFDDQMVSGGVDGGFLSSWSLIDVDDQMIMANDVFMY